jgi:hypothetical protein
MTESCLNAEKAVVSLLRTHKDTPPEQIIKEFGDQIKVIINMFIKYKHPVDRDIYVWLQKLGIPTQ